MARTPLAVIAVVLALPSGAAAAAKPKVVRVVDGNTVVVRDDGHLRTIHLIGVDAPAGSECGAADAKDTLKRLLPKGAKVRLVRDKSVRGAARYVYRGDALINASLLKSGGAPAANTDGLKLEQKLESAQQVAQQGQRGVWKTCPPPPGETAPPPGTPPTAGQPPAAGTVTGPEAIARARNDLRGRYFTRITADTFHSNEIRLNLCSDGTYVQDVSYHSDFSGDSFSRGTGTWEISAAQYTPQYGAARVLLHGSDGSEGVDDFYATGPTAVWVNGQRTAYVGPSDLCA